MNLGGLIDQPGSTKKNKTGSWRSGIRPVWRSEKCLDCGICFHYCPEETIIFKEGKMHGINYDYCKGCLLCVKECPHKALVAEKET
ncbi:4Fe-4S binding protein [Candidatus Parcubacteria bacterium]|nr:4Fe-4S binding protein [Candidatus Parcubacteria bacterium]